MKTITLSFLEQIKACEPAKKKFQEKFQNEIDLLTLVKTCIEIKENKWAVWLVSQLKEIPEYSEEILKIAVDLNIEVVKIYGTF